MYEPRRPRLGVVPLHVVLQDDPDAIRSGSPLLRHAIEDCVYQARWGFAEHAATLREHHMPVPRPADEPTIVVRNQAAPEPV